LTPGLNTLRNGAIQEHLTDVIPAGKVTATPTTEGEPMEFSSKDQGDFTVLTAAGRMDTLTAPEFETAVRAVLDAKRTRVVADMHQVDYISSAGLRSILVAAKKVKAAGGELLFAGVTGMVLDVFTISGFKSMFRLFDTADDAVRQG
jgi:anti-sigma B factor antagonist